MEREQTTIRLPKELKDQLHREAEDLRQTTLRIGDDLYYELKKIANRTGLTITALVLVAIWWSVLKLKY